MERLLGVGHVPEDRHRVGLVMPFEACESAMLGFHREPVYGAGCLYDRRAIVADARARWTAFDVRPPAPLLKTANFSGGNQQKIVLAREIERNPKILLVGQPTRGVDIGAIEFIHKRIVAQRDAARRCSWCRSSSTRSSRSPTGSSCCAAAGSPASGARRRRTRRISAS